MKRKRSPLPQQLPPPKRRRLSPSSSTLPPADSHSQPDGGSSGVVSLHQQSVPPPSLPIQQQQLLIPPQPNSMKGRRRAHLFSLVVCQRRSDGKFLLVHEIGDRGYWLPGGHVEPGETYSEAAIRETQEEAGVDVQLEGIIHTDVRVLEDGWKQRMIFFARPVSDDAVPKSLSQSDEHSKEAMWISFDELRNDVRLNRKKLRGNEPIKFFGSVLQFPNRIAPMSVLSERKKQS